MIALPVLLFTTFVGLWYGLPYAWVAAVGLICEAVYRPFDSWARSEKSGSNAVGSAFFRMLLSMAGAVGSVAFWVALGLCAYWAWAR